jgi:hypothetical protein
MPFYPPIGYTMEMVKAVAACLAILLGLYCLLKCGLWFVGWMPVVQQNGWSGVLPFISARRWSWLAIWSLGAVISLITAAVLISGGRRDDPDA